MATEKLQLLLDPLHDHLVNLNIDPQEIKDLLRIIEEGVKSLRVAVNSIVKNGEVLKLLMDMAKIGQEIVGSNQPRTAL